MSGDRGSWECRLTQAKGLANMVSIAGHSLDGPGGNLALAGGLMSLASAISDEIDRAVEEIMAELGRRP